MSRPVEAHERSSGTVDTPAAGADGRATLDSVAERAGVSRQTVSNVLNNPHIVRPATAERVREAIRHLGYRPHLAAKQLRTRRSRVLGLRVARGGGDAVFDRFLHALTDSAGSRDYRIMLYTADDDAAEINAYDELLSRWDIDGFILTGTHPADRRTQYLADRGVPCVTFGRPWDDSGHHPWVDVDGAAGTEAATRHLISLGHTRIDFLGWPSGSGVGDDRESGWERAMKAAGLAITEPARSTNDLLNGRQAAARLLDRNPPTALVCVSDLLALGAQAEIHARWTSADSPITVIGFDNSDLAEVTGLSSVDQPIRTAADHCARMLISLLESDEPDRPVEQVLLAPELKIRLSAPPG